MLMEVWKLVAVLVGYAVSGAITWAIVACNRKAVERAGRIDKKNQLLRSVERRAVYIWSGEKGPDFNLELEVSYLREDIQLIRDEYTSLKKASKSDIPPEVRELEVATIVDVESFTPEKRKDTVLKVRILAENLRAIPRK